MNLAASISSRHTGDARQRRLRVAHLDDNAFELDRIEKALRANAHTTCFDVESYSEAPALLERLRHDPRPEIILLDVNLGRSGGSGILVAENARSLAPDAVILMRSGISDLEVVTEALAKGADDYLLKASDDVDLAKRLWASYELCRMAPKETPVADQDLHVQRERPQVVGAAGLHRVDRANFTDLTPPPSGPKGREHVQFHGGSMRVKRLLRLG